MYKIRHFIARKLIGKCTISFYIKGKGNVSDINMIPKIVPDIYLDGEFIVDDDKYRKVTLIWR